MPSQKISDMPTPELPLSGDELIPLVQEDVNYAITARQLADNIPLLSLLIEDVSSLPPANTWDLAQHVAQFIYITKNGLVLKNNIDYTYDGITTLTLIPNPQQTDVYVACFIPVVA